MIFQLVHINIVQENLKKYLLMGDLQIIPSDSEILVVGLCVNI